MRPPNKALQVILGLLLLVILIGGIYLVSGEVFSLLSSLDHQLAVILVATLLASLAVAFGIRRAGYISGVQHYRIEKKAESYSRLLDAWFRVLSRQRSKSVSDKVGVELDVAQQQILLWATPQVIKIALQVQHLRHQEPPESPLLRSAVEQMIREMRSDLGQSSLSLPEGDLVDLAFAERDNNIQPIVRR